MLDWLQENEPLAWWLAAGSVVIFVGSLVALPIVVARMPADYFLHKEDRTPPGHPVARLLVRIGKNALGAVLLVTGVLMLVLPGQGLLTILAGLMLLEFPGKRRAERWLIGRAPIHRTVDWIRRKRGAAPLKLP